jgi:hypothetical protein
MENNYNVAAAESEKLERIQEMAVLRSTIDHQKEGIQRVTGDLEELRGSVTQKNLEIQQLQQCLNSERNKHISQIEELQVGFLLWSHFHV